MWGGSLHLCTNRLGGLLFLDLFRAFLLFECIHVGTDDGAIRCLELVEFVRGYLHKTHCDQYHVAAMDTDTYNRADFRILIGGAD